MKPLSRWAMVVFLSVVLWPALAVAQQAYPNKPIRFITPYAPGGSTTVVARLVGQKLSERWGQQVIVDNRPGGNTVIGTEAVAKSPADGYTIMMVASAHVINPLLISDLPYDAIKDFAAVATVVSTEYVLTVHHSVPAGNLQEFIAMAKSRPGQLNYASSGTGGAGHLASEMLNIMAGLTIQHIPYKGAGPAVTDLLGGQVQVFVSPPSNVVPHIKTGKLKAIAISGETRLSALPQVPTFTQAGLPGFDVKSWQGVLAPAGTPKAILDKLSAEIAGIVAMPDIREKLDGQGLEPFVSTPEQFAALMKADTGRFGKVIKTANIKFEN